MAGEPRRKLTRQALRGLIAAIGRDDAAAGANADLSEALWSKGIWHAMRWWDGWSHDWPYWQNMILHYINGPA